MLQNGWDVSPAMEGSASPCWYSSYARLLRSEALGSASGSSNARCQLFFCEEDLDELKRRQHAINQHYGIEPADLAGKLEYAPRAGMENILVEFAQGSNDPTYTPPFDQLKARRSWLRDEAIVLDTSPTSLMATRIYPQSGAADHYPCDGIAMDIGGLVVLVGTPQPGGHERRHRYQRIDRLEQLREVANLSYKTKSQSQMPLERMRTMTNAFENHEEQPRSGQRAIVFAGARRVRLGRRPWDPHR